MGCTLLFSTRGACCTIVAGSHGKHKLLPDLLHSALQCILSDWLRNVHALQVFPDQRQRSCGTYAGYGESPHLYAQINGMQMSGPSRVGLVCCQFMKNALCNASPCFFCTVLKQPHKQLKNNQWTPCFGCHMPLAQSVPDAQKMVLFTFIYLGHFQLRSIKCLLHLVWRFLMAKLLHLNTYSQPNTRLCLI